MISMNQIRLRHPLFALLSFLAIHGAAQAQTAITSLPYTISTPGHYVLNGNLGYSGSTGAAITINTSWVDLDFRGHWISTTVPGTTAKGVSASGRDHITVHDGEITGFNHGIYLGGLAAPALVVQRMRVLNSSVCGIFAEGVGTIVSENHVAATGGNSLGSQVRAIFANGTLAEITNNHIVNVVPATNDSSNMARGIQANDALVKDNHIRSSTKSLGSIGVVVFEGSTKGGRFIIGNVVSGFDMGLVFSSENGIFKDNIVLESSLPYANGTGTGDNYPTP